MGDTEFFEKELKELNDLLRVINNVKIIKNIKFMVEDYIEDEKKSNLHV